MWKGGLGVSVASCEFFSFTCFGHRGTGILAKASVRGADKQQKKTGECSPCFTYGGNRKRFDVLITGHPVTLPEEVSRQVVSSRAVDV